MSAVETDASLSQQGHYAGAVTRLVSFVVDQAISATSFAAGTAVVAWVLALVSSDRVEIHLGAAGVGLLYTLWAFAYLAYPWAVSGKTPGMALMGLRVVRTDGDDAGGRRAAVRAITLPLSFLTLGIGFLPILLGRRRRALHDLLAGTVVVYAWDARAARWRFLARRNEGRATGTG